MIDPIDGTMNFVHGLPHTCISVALLINKVTEIGIVYNPIVEQLFTARRGQGAFMNKKAIKVSGEKEMKKSLIMVEMGTSRDPEKMKIVMENLQILTCKVHGYIIKLIHYTMKIILIYKISKLACVHSVRRP